MYVPICPVNDDTIEFILDGMNVVAELENQNSIIYLRGNGLEGYLKNGTNRKYYYNEPNGSTYIIYGDESNQFEPVGEYAYGGFGNFIWDNWQETSFAYAGEYHDDETGFIYLRNHYYDPNTGRFISEDPAMDGLNWYVYCDNNPVNFVDPWGLKMRYSSYEDALQSVIAMNEMGGYSGDGNGYSINEVFENNEFVGYEIGDAVGEYSGGSSTSRKLFTLAISDPNIINCNLSEVDGSNTVSGNVKTFLEGIEVRVNEYIKKREKPGTRSANLALEIGNNSTIQSLGLVLVHEIVHALNWNMRLDLNFYYLKAGISIKVYNAWQEVNAITVQYQVAKELGGAYGAGNPVNIYYIKDGGYTYDGFSGIYGISPSKFKDYSGNPYIWYFGPTIYGLTR